MTDFKGSIRFWSILAGASLIIMAVAAGIAYGLVFPSFYVDGDPAATAANIAADPLTYNIGLLFWGIVFITDLVVTWGFFRFLLPLHKALAVASGALRLVYTVSLGVALAFLLGRNPDAFLEAWSAGLVVFGLHLIVTGAAVLRSTVFLKVLGVLLVVAGAGYSVIHGIQNFVPAADGLAGAIESVLAVPMTVGEMAFGIWLLIRGGRNVNRRASGLRAPGAA